MCQQMVFVLSIIMSSITDVNASSLGFQTDAYNERLSVRAGARGMS